jgi:tetratricopeptide (TPR) repeat protein
LPQTHNAFAAILLFYDRDYVRAKQELETSQRLAPNDSGSYDLLSYVLSATGETQEAITQIKKAADLDPLSPMIWADVGWMNLMAGRYTEAIEEFNKGLELDPNFENGLDELSYVYVSMGRYEEAIVSAKKAVEISHNSPIELAALGFHYGMSGNRAEAEKTLAQLEEQSKKTYVSPYFLGLVHAGLGENDQAFPLFMKACGDRTGDWGLIFVKVEPFMQKFRSDPRYNDLLKCMGL